MLTITISPDEDMSQAKRLIHANDAFRCMAEVDHAIQNAVKHYHVDPEAEEILSAARAAIVEVLLAGGWG